MQVLTRDELQRLSPPERLSLIQQLWDSLEGEQLSLTTAQKTELDQRLAVVDTTRRTTWEDLREELESRAR